MMATDQRDNNGILKSQIKQKKNSSEKRML